MRLTVHEFTTLDGVVQGPGSPDEDTRGGFELGGWNVPYADEAFGGIVSGWFEKPEAILLGRVTYGMMAAFWPQVTDPDNPVAAKLNGLPKYVASTTLTDPGWEHTTVLGGDVVEQVKELKARPGGELQVHGSCGLVQTLHAAGLVDEFRLIVFPTVLGQGRRLFPEGGVPTGFTVVDRAHTPAGGTYLALTPAPYETGSFVVRDGRDVVG